MASTSGTTQSGPVVDRVSAIITPIVSDLGLDLYDLEFAGGILRVTVDTQPGQPSGVSLDTIALITRLISREFDHNDPMPGRYTLEVTSPGLERSLRTPKHFQREIGKTVNIRLSAPVDGTRRVQGVIVAADDVRVTVRSEDAELTETVVEYSSIEKAKTVFQWGPAPKPGSKKS
jgi:ribosome maturation factor RimP